MSTILLVVIILLLTNKKEGPELYREELNTIQIRVSDELNQIYKFHREIDSFTTIDQFSLFRGDLLYRSNHPFQIVKNNRLIFWTDQRVVLEPSFLIDQDSVFFLDVPFGKFLIVRSDIKDMQLYSIIELSTSYLLQNQYLQNRINKRLLGNNVIEINTAVQEWPVKFNNSMLFSVAFNSAKSYVEKGHMLKPLVAFHLIFLLTFIFNLTYQRPLKLKHVLVATITLLLARGAYAYFDVLNVIFNESNYLWDPRIFAASSLNPSLGALTINSASIYIIAIIWTNYLLDLNVIRSVLKSKNKSSILLTVCFMWCGFLLFFLHSAFQSIYSNSSISVDISRSVDIQFPSLVIYFITIVHGIILFYANQAFAVYWNTYRGPVALKWVLLLITISLAILEYYLGDEVLSVLLFANIIYQIIINRFRLAHAVHKISFPTSLYYLLGVIFCALIFSLLVKRGETNRKMESMQRFASNLLIESDDLAEFLLKDVKNQIENDPFVTNKFLSPFANKKQVTDKISRYFQTGYLSKYEADVHLYNAKGQPLNAGTVTDLDSFKQEFSASLIETETGGLYRTTNEDKEYFLMVELKRYNYTVGYIIVVLNQKKLTPQAVFPGLLANSEFQSNNKEIDYAIFEDGELKSATSNFNQIVNSDQITELQHGTISTIGERLALVIANERNKRTAVVTVKDYSRYQIFTNFSLAFITYLLVGVLIFVFVLLIRLARGTSINFTSKIQLALSLALFLPLIAISFTIYSVVIDQSKTEIISSYEKKISSVANVVSENLEKYYQRGITKEELSDNLVNYAPLIGEDLNVFGTDGYLLTSSQPAIFSNHILPKYVHPEAFRQIASGKKEPIIVGQRSGLLSFRSAYLPVYQQENDILIGIASMPFFEYRAQKDSKIIEILSNILNSFSIIFLITYALSYATSTILTKPLKQVSDRIKGLNFTEKNEPIQWGVRDEIGQLVSAYNDMLEKLEISKAELANREKEEAWREMAKQVAHEIKNPLTPMKLNLQHLQAKLKNGNEDDNILKRNIQSIIQQVDNLSEIAASFSAFAQMPVPTRERFDVSKVLEQTLNLFKGDEHNIRASIEPGAYIEGDQKLFSRIFQNIIINAKQASASESPIEVSLMITGENVFISINDYGKGISEDLREKIFLPNFTTKSTGSGIGLAIAKRGIEHAGGKIWFDSAINTGTTFYIEIPAA